MNIRKNLWDPLLRGMTNIFANAWTEKDASNNIQVQIGGT